LKAPSRLFSRPRSGSAPVAHFEQLASATYPAVIREPRKPAGPTANASRSIRLGGTTYPLVLPTLRDPRLHSAAVIFSLQALGQTVLGFQLSIAQILVSLFTCAVLEIGIAFRQQRIIMWPASALLTGNSVAFILRAVGTRSGDWWSLNGASLFIFAAAISLLSKYALRVGNRHIFNPSNFGLVICFLLFGSQYTNPQDLWWGPMSPGLAATLAIIVVGGLLIVRELKMLTMVITFWAAFAVSIGAIAAQGHCISARWHYGAICGGSFWALLVTSPEILVFIFFMMTDPKTAPRGQLARVVYGLSLAFVSALLIAPWRTEFGTKVGLLSGLVVICALLPLAERYLSAADSTANGLLATTGGWAKTLQTGGGTRSVANLIRRAALTIAILSLGILLLQIGANLGAKAPSEMNVGPALNGALLASRPVIAIDPATVPPITISTKAQHFNPSLNQDTARRLVRDVIADLIIEADAMKEQRASLLATAATGDSLRTLEQDLISEKAGGQTVVPSYQFGQITIVLAYDPNAPQSPPDVAVRIVGTIHRATYTASSPQSLISQSDSPYDRTFAVGLVEGHYLITRDVSD